MKKSLRTDSLLRYALFLNSSNLGYVCLRCRNQVFTARQGARNLVTASTTIRRYASSSKDLDPFIERLRRKLWKEGEGPRVGDVDGEKKILERSEKARGKVAPIEDINPTSKTAQEVNQQDQYVPATTWNDLDSIGGPTGWWEEAWDQKHHFEGFMAPSKLTSPEEVSMAIHRTLVEIFTAKEARLPMNPSAGGWDKPYNPAWGSVGFQQFGNGQTVAIFPNEKLRQEVLDILKEAKDSTIKDDRELEISVVEDMDEEDEDVIEEEVDDEDEDKDIETLSGSSPLIDSTWLDVQFTDQKLKFAILKRCMQLTGSRIPDPLIHNLSTTKALFAHLVTKPKPRKLAEFLQLKEELKGLPNLQMMDRRYTPIDREKEVGRWKVIERELQRRDLPITGHTYT